MTDFSAKWIAFWKMHGDRLTALGKVLGRLSVLVFSAYLVGSTLAAASLGFFSGVSSESAPRPRSGEIGRPQLNSLVNHRELRKQVVSRNLFNSDGELPDESEEISEVANSGEGFNPGSPCADSKLPLEFLGVILSENPQDSMATLREKGFSVADVYRVGDTLLGYESYRVFAIEPRRLVLDTEGMKECIKIEEKELIALSSPASPSKPAVSQSSERVSGSSVSLEASYVESALGPGFSKILEDGRLVPFNRDGAMVGFKLIGAKGDSLWRKIGLNSGDVITSVNGVSMAQPEQGFTIFEALQNEREIRIDFLSKGTEPANVSVQIQ